MTAAVKEPVTAINADGAVVFIRQVAPPVCCCLPITNTTYVCCNMQQIKKTLNKKVLANFSILICSRSLQCHWTYIAFVSATLNLDQMAMGMWIFCQNMCVTKMIFFKRVDVVVVGRRAENFPRKEFRARLFWLLYCTVPVHIR